MNKEALNRIISILYNIKDAAKTFNMERWRYSNPKCGTVLCAIGHACMDPWFNEQGLTFGGLCDNEPYFKDADTTGFLAISIFLDISVDDAFWLFSTEHYSPEDFRNPTVVANRIREYIRYNGR